MKDENPDEVFKCTIRDGGEGAKKNLNCILASWVVLKRLKEVLSFRVLSRNLTGSSEK
jgi:hypothetical protein